MKTKLKILLTAMFVVSLFTVNGQGIKISALPTLTSPDSALDYIPITHFGTTYKITPGKLFGEFGGSGGGGSAAPDNEILYGNSDSTGTESVSSFYFDHTPSNFVFNVIDTISTQSALLLTHGAAQIGEWSIVDNGDRCVLSMLSQNNNTSHLGLTCFKDGGLGGAIQMNAFGKHSYTDGVESNGMSLMTDSLTLHLGSTYLQIYGSNASGSVVPELRFNESYSNGTTAPNYVGLKASASLSANTIWTLPTADGDNGDLLTTNGSGVLGWFPAPSASPALDFTHIGFGDEDGFLGSSANLIYNDEDSVMTVNGDIFTDGLKTSAQDAIHISAYGGSTGQTGELRFYQISGGGTNYVGFKGQDGPLGTNTIWTLPASDGSPGYVLGTDGSKNLGWTPPPTATSPAGGDKAVQFSNGGAFSANGDGWFIWTENTDDAFQLRLKNGNAATYPSYSFVDGPSLGMFYDSGNLGITGASGEVNISSSSRITAGGSDVQLIIDNGGKEIDLTTDSGDIKLNCSGLYMNNSPGFTGEGDYTHFVIVNGIIMDAY